jgi:hypothetical protein
MTLLAPDKILVRFRCPECDRLSAMSATQTNKGQPLTQYRVCSTCRAPEHDRLADQVAATAGSFRDS